MTTEVSSKPRGLRSATRSDALIDRLIDVFPHAFPVQPGCVAEGFDGDRRCNETVPAQRTQLTHWPTIAAHHEAAALIERTHDATAVVAQLSLADVFTHMATIALNATVAGAKRFQVRGA